MIRKALIGVAEGVMSARVLNFCSTRTPGKKAASSFPCHDCALSDSTGPCYRTNDPSLLSPCHPKKLVGKRPPAEQVQHKRSLPRLDPT
eukprot:scaffold4864_cov134-Pinguiococcus_pyrenoidosus.AAC.1